MSPFNLKKCLAIAGLIATPFLILLVLNSEGYYITLLLPVLVVLGILCLTTIIPEGIRLGVGLVLLALFLVYYLVIFFWGFDGGCPYGQWTHDVIAKCGSDGGFRGPL